jgi:uncharacterized protein YndB with AHSA1/START domain
MAGDEFIVKKQVVIEATPAEVWEALTNPELTKKYFFKCAVNSDWKAGSPITFTRKILWYKFELKGKIEKIETEKLLQYSLVNSKLFGRPDPSRHSLVTDELSYNDGKTTLSISDDVGEYEGAEKRYKKSLKGWDTILSGLKKMIEEKGNRGKQQI